MRQVLFFSVAPIQQQLLNQLEQLSFNVSCWNLALESLITTQHDEIVSHVIIDVRCLSQNSNKDIIANTVNCATLFIDFQSLTMKNCETNAYCYLGHSFSGELLATNLQLCRYKFEARKKIAAENQLLQSALSCIGNSLIYLDDKGNVSAINDAAAMLFGVKKSVYINKPWHNLIVARRDLSAKQTQQFLAAAITTKAVTKIQPLAIRTENKGSLLIDGIIGPIKYPSGQSGVILFVRKLTDLAQIPVALSQDGDAGQSYRKKMASSMMLINPDNFKQVNQTYGTDIGDKLLDEISLRIGQVLRASDLTSRYGGAVFLVLLYDASTQQVHNLQNHLMQTLAQPYALAQDHGLTFSCGVAINDQYIAYSPVELFYFSNFAMCQAKELGGDQMRQWQHQSASQQIGNFDRLSGNFSDRGSADYQKMLMLWGMMSSLESFHHKDSFIEQLLKQMISGFHLDSAAFVTLKNNRIEIDCALNNNNARLSGVDIKFSKHQQTYINQITGSDQQTQAFTSVREQQGIEVILPLKINRKIRAVLWLACYSLDDIDIKDHHLLSNIADFIAVSIEKIEHQANQLADQQDNQQDNQQDKGENQYQSDHKDKFWYGSDEMLKLMQDVELVSVTNATVLIRGESGTGKEMVAKRIHNLSQRSTKPYVIVDCGAIVGSLMERELFGHVKGAFTGADKKASGRIQQADGGTLFLDEVGELPLEVQVKLLRFVQDKQFSPIGSTQYKSVNVRLIAATNVDLEQKMRQGLFREDLYYRLNVFSVKTLALRDRQSDIMLLAERYLAAYNQEYKKHVLGFTDLAKQAINEYRWPGNVRELKNLINRALILCQDNRMDCCHLGLYPVPGARRNESTPMQQSSTVQSSQAYSCSVVNKASIATAERVTSHIYASGELEFLPEARDILHPMPSISHPLVNPGITSQVIVTTQEDKTQITERQLSGKADQNLIWRDLVKQQISPTESCHPFLAISLVLEKQLYQLSLQEHHEIMLQAATALNIAESTFRRRWKKLTQDVPGAQSNRLTSQVIETLLLLLNTGITESKIQLMQRRIAIACLELKLPAKLGAQILAMSKPTYRKFLKQLKACNLQKTSGGYP